MEEKPEAFHSESGNLNTVILLADGCELVPVRAGIHRTLLEAEAVEYCTDYSPDAS